MLESKKTIIGKSFFYSHKLCSSVYRWWDLKQQPMVFFNQKLGCPNLCIDRKDYYPLSWADTSSRWRSKPCYPLRDAGIAGNAMARTWAGFWQRLAIVIYQKNTRARLLYELGDSQTRQYLIIFVGIVDLPSVAEGFLELNGVSTYG